MAAANYTVTVYADFSGHAFGTAPSWSDLTADVLTTGIGSPIKITRGKRDEQGDVSPGTMTLTLDNSTGKYTPGYASSPFYPNVKLNVHMRVTVNVAGGPTLTRYDGYVTGWEVSYVDGLHGICNVTCTDYLGIAGQLFSMQRWGIEQIKALKPSAFYAMQDASGSTTFTDLMQTWPNATAADSKYGTGGGVIAAENATGILGEPTSAAFITNTNHGGTGNPLAMSYINVPVTLQNGLAGGGTAGNGYTFFLFAEVPSTMGANDEAIFALCDGTGVGNNAAYLFVNNTQWGIRRGDGTQVVASSVGHQNDKVTSFAWTCDQFDVGGTAYANGASLGNYTSALPLNFQNSRVQMALGGWVQSTMNHFEVPYQGLVCYLAIFETRLGAAQITKLHNSCYVGLAERSDLRFIDLIGYRTVPSGYTAQTGLTTCDIDSLNGKTMQAALLEIANAEQGAVFAGRDGQLNFVSRTSLMVTAGASIATIDAQADFVQIGATWRLDSQDIANDITVSRTSGSGSPGVARDAGSMSFYGDLSKNLTLSILDDATVANTAAWLLANFKDPTVRAPQITVDYYAWAASATINLVTHPEADATWSAYGTKTITRSGTGGAIVGGYETATRATGDADGRYNVVPLGAIFDGSTMVTGSIYVRPSVTATMTAAFVRTDTFATINGPAVSCPSGAWTRLSVTTTPASVAAGWTLVSTVPGQLLVGQSVDASNAQVEVGPVMSAYFDGSQANCIWNGTANASTSTRNPVDALPTLEVMSSFLNVTNLPATVPTAEYLVLGYDESIAVDGYTVTYYAGQLPLQALVANARACDSIYVAGY